MHRLWSERRWLKLTLAHGCYWHRCAFCDTSLDYIRRYDPADAETIVGWMERAMADTGLCRLSLRRRSRPARPARQSGARSSWRAACASSGGPTSASRSSSRPSSARLLRALGLPGADRRARMRPRSAARAAWTRASPSRRRGRRHARARRRRASWSTPTSCTAIPRRPRRKPSTRSRLVRRLFAARLPALGLLAPLRPHRCTARPLRERTARLHLRILDDRQGAFARNEVPLRRARPAAIPALYGAGPAPRGLQLHARRGPGARRAHLVRFPRAPPQARAGLCAYDP